MNVVAGKWCGVRVEGEGACTIQAPGQGGVQNYRCKASLRGYPRLDLYTAFAVMLKRKSSREAMIISGGNTADGSEVPAAHPRNVTLLGCVMRGQTHWERELQRQQRSCACVIAITAHRLSPLEHHRTRFGQRRATNS